jgi:hypothetical protein
MSLHTIAALEQNHLVADLSAFRYHPISMLMLQELYKTLQHW